MHARDLGRNTKAAARFSVRSHLFHPHLQVLLHLAWSHPSEGSRIPAVSCCVWICSWASLGRAVLADLTGLAWTTLLLTMLGDHEWPVSAASRVVRL